VTVEYYNQKYAAGDYVYNPESEKNWLQRHVVDRFGLIPGDKVLDLGCGKGLHASLLSEFGMKVYGIDQSAEGIRGAIARGSEAVFVNDSAANLANYFDGDYFDLIFCRGMSWFHRKLHEVCDITGVNVSEKLPELFRFIKPGGLFVLQISTDFSGINPVRDTHNNHLSSFIELFEPYGEVIHKSNWDGVAVTDDDQAAEVKGNLVIATRK
jgi:SAM-dependent methyltransferase